MWWRKLGSLFARFPQIYDLIAILMVANVENIVGEWIIVWEVVIVKVVVFVGQKQKIR